MTSRRKQAWIAAIVGALFLIAWKLQWPGLLGAFVAGGLVIGFWWDCTRMAARRRRQLRERYGPPMRRIEHKQGLPEDEARLRALEEMERIRREFKRPYRGS